jgi:hypothetical protein
VLLATVPDMQAALSLLLSRGATAPVYHLAEEVCVCVCVRVCVCVCVW